METLKPWKETVLYNVYTLTYKEDEKRHPQTGRGSIRGLTEKIPYFVELGVNAIWVSPPYPGPMIDCGYDTTDLTGISPDLGTLEDMDEFIKECHENGIRVLMDFIPNHTSEQHEWFQKSRNREPGYEDWYIWHPGEVDENGKRVPPNNWASIFSQINRQARDRGEMPWLKVDDWTPTIPAWRWDEARGEFYLAMFLKEQPDLNWKNPNVVEAMKDIMRFWLDRGVDGFRVDAVNHMGKNYDFPDEQINTAYNEKDFTNPFDQLLLFNSSNYPEMINFCIREMSSVAHEEKYKDRDIRLILEAYAGEALLREMNEVDPEVATTFNFGPFHMDWNAIERKVQMDYYYENINPKSVANQVYGNHDNPRLATRFGEKIARSLAVLSLCAPSSMAIIYGSDELGLHDGDVPMERRKDTVGFRDGDRTPIIWDDAKPNAGFSNANSDDLFLPINENDLGISVARQRTNPTSFFTLYKENIRLRNELTAIREGHYVKLGTDNEEVMAFGCKSGDDQAIVLINFSPYIQHTNLLGNEFAACKSVLSSIDVTQNKQEGINLEEGIHLQPHEALVVVPTARKI